MRKPILLATSLLIAAVAITSIGIGTTRAKAADKKKKTEIRAIGSDTLVQLATAWAESYRKVKPNVFVNVNGGGSGVGIAKLIQGETDICNASREMKPEEKAKLKAATGKEAKEFAGE